MKPEALLHDLQESVFRARTARRDDDFGTARWLAVLGFVEAPAAGLELPLDLARHELFSCVSGQALRAVPPGTTVSYAQIARRLGIPKASPRRGCRDCRQPGLRWRCRANRVIRSDGALVRLIAGVSHAKRALLEPPRAAPRECRARRIGHLQSATGAVRVARSNVALERVRRQP